MVRIIDMGFHPAVASFLWATTMPEILDLSGIKNGIFHRPCVRERGRSQAELSLRVFGADPARGAGGRLIRRRSRRRMRSARRGSRTATPTGAFRTTWRRTNFLYAKDDAAAAKYYNIAAETPGIPAICRAVLSELWHRDEPAPKDGTAVGDDQRFHERPRHAGPRAGVHRPFAGF